MGEIINFKHAKEAKQNLEQPKKSHAKSRMLIRSGLSSVMRFVSSLTKTFTFAFLFVMSKVCKKFTKLFAILTITVAGVELMTDKIYWPSILTMLILKVIFFIADTISNIFMNRLGGHRV
ncbi:hypothetical protein ABW286_21935 [Erwinia papayae]|uniref:Uncharacterized protein n=1 Tax=Erwinia papayae TaxID=206499 RepID=A0ABV3N7J4_9GAMM